MVMLMMRAKVGFFAASAVVVVGCQAELDAEIASPSPDAGSLVADAGGLEPDAGDVVAPPVPPAAPVRFKGGARLRADWARGLDLAPDEVCQELGRYDCATEVHNIVLGGVEPYVLNINRPLEAAPVTAPLAVERMALAACSTRVDRDLADPSRAVVFRPEAGGAWTAETRRAALERLIEGLLKRRANDPELDRLAGLGDPIPGPDVREWAVSSCFVVATSLESLFY